MYLGCIQIVLVHDFDCKSERKCEMRHDADRDDNARALRTGDFLVRPEIERLVHIGERPTGTGHQYTASDFNVSSNQDSHKTSKKGRCFPIKERLHPLLELLTNIRENLESDC